MEFEKVKQDNLVLLAIKRFQHSRAESLGLDKSELENEIKSVLEEYEMAPYYEAYCSADGIIIEEERIASWRKSNQQKLESLEKAIKDAEENLGETEIREANLKKSMYFHEIGDKERALEAYKRTLELTSPTGQKLDIMFSILRIGLVFGESDLLRVEMEKARGFAEEGGDWERRNRLKVYDGVYLMSLREFKKASNLFLASIATFSSYELLSMREFVTYTVLMAMISVDRATLHDKVLQSPEILTYIRALSPLEVYATSLYECSYEEFFESLVGVSDILKKDPFVEIHEQFYHKEMRLRAYNQYLESYRSVSLGAMAKSFGVRPEFLDADLARFIAAGRLSCRIDKVGGAVETRRPDSTNAQYQAIIRKGDALLNRIQKLSRVIEM